MKGRGTGMASGRMTILTPVSSYVMANDDPDVT